MKDEEVPTAVWSGSFRLFGVDLWCHVLSDGRRVIDEDSITSLLEAMGDGSDLDLEELSRFHQWYTSTNGGGKSDE